MKKFLFALISIMAFSVMTYNIVNDREDTRLTETNGGEYKESYNSEINMYLARNIAAMTDAEEIAVIGNSKNILVGIELKSGTGGRYELRKKAEKIIRQEYGNAKIDVEIETEKAEKIIDFAENMEKGMPSGILSARMEYLLED